MSSEFGKILRISVFGESHGTAIGINADGLPAGEKIDIDELQSFLGRRRGGGKYSTKRAEEDKPVFLSGLVDGKICGSPLCAVIYNGDTRSSDYAELADKPRPSHADYTAFRKWGGNADMRGGGHFSGRLTAPLCIIGGIAKQLLSRRGIYVGAHLLSVADISDKPFPLMPDQKLFTDTAAKAFPVIDDIAARAMQAEIENAAAVGDSVGGTVECAVTGLPVGLGSPMFDGVENRLASVLFGIPAVKGVEFGAGFSCTTMRGSACNDAFRIDERGTVITETNNSGGIQGGITNGMPIVFRIAVKPTPSISMTQRTVSLSRNENTELSVVGRHDPCIAHRAVPVAEAAAAAVILDMLLEEGAFARTDILEK